MARLRAPPTPITLPGSSQSVGGHEWGLYFELITGIYAVIQDLVTSSKHRDTQRGYDTHAAQKEIVASEKNTDNGKRHLISACNAKKTKAWLL